MFNKSLFPPNAKHGVQTAPWKYDVSSLPHSKGSGRLSSLGSVEQMPLLWIFLINNYKLPVQNAKRLSTEVAA